MKHYDIITEFMSNPAVRQMPGFREFEKSVATTICGAEKETLLKSVDIIEIDKGIHEYSCPRCSWRNTVVGKFHKKKYHYCRSCGGKVENL